MNRDVILTHLLPILVKLSADPVPNVRFNVVKAMTEMINVLDGATVIQQIKPVISSLMEDQDKDVRHFAQHALLSA